MQSHDTPWTHSPLIISQAIWDSFTTTPGLSAMYFESTQKYSSGSSRPDRCVFDTTTCTRGPRSMSVRGRQSGLAFLASMYLAR